jgi:hypothetical protein
MVNLNGKRSKSPSSMNAILQGRSVDSMRLGAFESDAGDLGARDEARNRHFHCRTQSSMFSAINWSHWRPATRFPLSINCASSPWPAV